MLYPSQVVVSSSAYLVEISLQVHSGDLILLAPKKIQELVEEGGQQDPELQKRKPGILLTDPGNL